MATEAPNALIEELKRDAEKGELLLWAAARGLTADVTDLVQTGADSCAKDKRGRQAVHYAASNGHHDILEFLFTKGVHLDVEDDVGRGALHYAAAGGHTSCVSFLLGKECWRDAPDAADDTPLHLAARSGGLAVVKTLAEAGAKVALPNKRALTPFAEAVLAGQIESAEYLGGLMTGGLEGALAQTYRDVPLLHLAAGLGQANAVEWLIRKQRCDVAATAADQKYTPLHAAAMSGDAGTVTCLLKLGADPLSQTLDGRLPLELVPKAAPVRAPPPRDPNALPLPEDPAGPPGQSGDSADPELVRSARKAFKALSRAAAEQGGVDLRAEVEAARQRRGAAKAASAARAEEGDGEPGEEGAAGESEEESDEEGTKEDLESPAALFLAQFLAMTLEERVSKVEAYARMEERQVSELPHLNMEAQAAITSLRQAMGMVELFGAIAALRADEDFQEDIRDPRVRDALAEAKRTNNLERYEDQAAVMSVANKFKRLHAVSRKAGGLQVVIDDLRAELPGNDPESTSTKMAEMRAAQEACAHNAMKVVLESASAAIPDAVRDRIVRRHEQQAAAGGDEASGAEAAGSQLRQRRGGKRAKKGADGAGREVEEDADSQKFGEDAATFKARIAQKARVDKLRAAATSAWNGKSQAEEDIGFVDRVAKDYDMNGGRLKEKRRWRLADHVGEELAQSLWGTAKALLFTLAAFAIMWVFGLMPHQQTAALQARLEEARQRKAAAAAAAAAKAGVVPGVGPELAGMEEPQQPSTAEAAIETAATVAKVAVKAAAKAAKAAVKTKTRDWGGSCPAH